MHYIQSMQITAAQRNTPLERGTDNREVEWVRSFPSGDGVEGAVGTNINTVKRL